MISVCIATYNGEKYIKKQIDSILNQLTNNDEIIISDDGSIDKTIEIIESFNSPIIHFYINKGEHGYTANFENALKQAKGDFIFLADQDDVWKPDKVSTCISRFHSCDFIISDANIIDDKGNNISDSFFALRKPKKGFVGNIIKFGYLGCCIAFKKEILHKALPFPPNHKLCTHDNWLTVIAMFYYKTYICNDKLISYRRHNDNSSNGYCTNSTSLLFKLRYRIYLIKWIILRLSH